MCPGVERWLRPRWFTAWTIILPVQLTLPCERGKERGSLWGADTPPHHERQSEEGGGNRMWVLELGKVVREPVAHERLNLITALVISCLIQHPLQAGDEPECAFLWKGAQSFLSYFLFCFCFFFAHLRVACHDGVVAIIVQWGCNGVQRAGSISVAADPVVLAPLGDLLAVFEPVDLWDKTYDITAWPWLILQLVDKRREHWQSISLYFFFYIISSFPKPVITVWLMRTEPGSQPRPVCVLAKGLPLSQHRAYVQSLHALSSTSHISDSQARKPSP